MTARQYLESLKKLSKKVDSQNKYVDELNAIVNKVTSSYKIDIVQESGQNTREKALVMLIDAKDEADRLSDEYLDRKIKVMGMISKMEKAEHKTILMSRYIELMSWSEISKAINRSLQNTYLYHKHALLEFEKIYSLINNSES